MEAGCEPEHIVWLEETVPATDVGFTVIITSSLLLFIGSNFQLKNWNNDVSGFLPVPAIKTLLPVIETVPFVIG